MWNAKLEALTLAAQAFKQEILLPPEGIVMGRSVLGKGFLKLPVEWGQVSNKHCKFYVDAEGHWNVTDLSRNGTMVNGAKVGKENCKELKGDEEVMISLATPGDTSTWVKWKFVLTETSPPQSAIKQDPATSKRKSIEPHTSAEEAPGRQTSVEPASAEAKRPRTADGTGHSALYAENANLRKQLEEALEAHQKEADEFRRRSKEQDEKHSQLLSELQTRLGAAEKKAAATAAASEAAHQLAEKIDEVAALQEKLASAGSAHRQLQESFEKGQAELTSAKRGAESLEGERGKLKQELEETQAAAESKSASLLTELQQTKEAAAAASTETAALIKNMEAAKAVADQQLKAAKEEIKSLECLRAEASGAADKARTDLAALEEELHKANQRWKKAQGREQMVRNELKGKEAVIQDMQPAYAKLKEPRRIEEQLLTEMAKALVRINAARSDYEEDAEEFEQHLGFALGGPAAMDVAEPGDETGELPQMETQDPEGQLQQLSNATQVPALGTQDPALPPQARLFGSPPAARPCGGSPARTAMPESRTVKGSNSKSGAKPTSQHAGSGHMGTPSPRQKAASLEVDNVAHEQNLDEQLAAAESQKQIDEGEASEKKQTELRAIEEGDVVVVTSQDSKRAQPKENRPPSETGENGRAVGGKEGSQQHTQATGSLVATSQVKSQPSAEDHVSNSEQEDEQSGGEKPTFRSPIRQLVKGQTLEDEYVGMD